ncbi:MAG: GtrA family protein [Rhizobiaceae bacterium]|nr:GtrA family protein [Rhizobiaceae bacterium]MCV0405984.1 GtrA family protein [Rhizobiaceae bacterium]
MRHTPSIPAIAILAAIVALAVHGAEGLPSLADSSLDNDSVMRVVVVRDLIAGQGWFDPMQYRMGLAGGFEMHWSRLVDAPIALLIVAVSPLLGQAGAEVLVAIAWPTLLFALSLGFIIHAARSLAGAGAMLPAAIIGGVTLHLSGLFTPGTFDHHNVQVALTLGLAACLAVPGAGRNAGLAAGAAAALMIAIGMETLPLVAAAGVAVALALAARPQATAQLASGYGIGFAGVSALAFMATVAPTRWGTPVCDAFSLAQAVPAILAGLGLSAIAVTAGSARMPVRLAALAALGLGIGLVIALAFPGCIADPYAGLPERLRTLWLDRVVEAQSVFDLFPDEPVALARFYATPLVALFVLAAAAAKRSLSAGEAMIGGMIAAALAFSLWQVRGSYLVLPLAVVPLAAWVAAWRERQERSASTTFALRTAAAWLVSFNMVWAAAVAATATAVKAGDGIGEEHRPGSEASCTARTAFAAIGALKPATVLVISNLGAPMLAHTHHRTLAGPYHRNIDGNLAALDIWLAGPAEAEEMARAAAVDFFAVCPSNSETRFLAQAAPEGLLAGLADGRVPSWLETVDEASAEPIRVWRVQP